MIQRSQKTGQYYCDGRGCGTDLIWFEAGPDEGCDGDWVCMDCNDSICASRPAVKEPKQEAA